jgi:hypothetical protein
VCSSDLSHAAKIEERLSILGYRGYPPALKSVAEIFERNCKSALKFRQYWQDYLELSQQEINSSAFHLGSRHYIGKETAEYLEHLARNNWVMQLDFDFVQKFLLAGDQYTYQGYIRTLEQKDFPYSIRNQALNL